MRKRNPLRPKPNIGMMAEKRSSREVQEKKGGRGQKVTGLSILPVDCDVPGLWGSRCAAATVGQGSGGLEKVAER